MMEPPIFYSHPLEFMENVSSLIALPKAHMTCAGGVLGSHHKMRSKVVLKPEVKKGFNKSEHNHNEEENEEKKYVKNSFWAKMLARAFKIDVSRCSQCDSDKVRIMAAVLNPIEVRRYLSFTKALSQPPPKKEAVEPLKGIHIHPHS